MKRFGGDRGDAAHAPSRPARSRRFAPKYALRMLAHSASREAQWVAEAVHATGFNGARAREFEDFVAGDRGVSTGLSTVLSTVLSTGLSTGLSAGGLPLPDPSFRERLRRQLWRIHVLSLRYRGTTTH